MATVVCLIADPARTRLDPGTVEAAGRILGAPPRWLADGEACEFAVADADLGPACEDVRAIVAGRAIDVAAVPAEARPKRLLVSDMDSTMITVECIDELADLIGVKAEVAAITRRAMNGELDFRAALIERAALLAGLPASVLDDVYHERVRPTPGARTLVATMRARGALTALVSGGFAPIVEHVRRDLGFDVIQANRLEVRSGRLTGRLEEPIHDAASKRALLERLRARQGLARHETAAVGDGANDLPMLAAAGLAVAFHAHPKVRATTLGLDGGPTGRRRSPGVAIDHADLRALLYLQGIPKAAFVD